MLVPVLSVGSIYSTFVLKFQVCSRLFIRDASGNRNEDKKEVPVMEKAFDLGWLVIITQKSKVNQLRISAAMDMGSFQAFEMSGEETATA